MADCHFALHTKHMAELASIDPKGNPVGCLAIRTFRVEGGNLTEA